MDRFAKEFVKPVVVRVRCVLVATIVHCQDVQTQDRHERREWNVPDLLLGLCDGTLPVRPLPSPEFLYVAEASLVALRNRCFGERPWRPAE